VSAPTVQLVRQIVWEPLASGRGGRDASAPSPAPAPPDTTPLLTRLARFLAGVRELTRSSEPFPWGTLERLLQDVVATLASSDQLFWTAQGPPVDGDVEYLALHQARTAVVAIRLGAALGHEGRRLVGLGAAASLFDAGLWQLPEHVATGSDPLSPEDEERYRSHPRLSAALLRRWEAPSDLVVDAVLQHHEREQGQGFPQGLPGAAVSQDAKILGLVDTYTGLTMPPAPRPRLRPHEAIREIVRSKHEAFPSPLVKALLSEISVFPPGTLVRLNTGEVGRVTAVNRNHPLRPRVEIVADGKGQRLGTPKSTDLADAPFLYITGAVAEGGR
jgi:hypothetical protein